ncbi:putative inner membrane protein [Stieleria maiorica]|uniref:Putative inner membrane protein n=1 Tax=Stieleria maiorica TaxID=2795974 RepID=A0A5B9MGK7_9BACT|nr:YeeE/YedE thiosulfate transporter family protein [Stieleria maiorica]QEF99246.1 putative inner membrane protein [Stieleria maiorica]
MSTITDKSQDTATPHSEPHHEAQDENPVSVSAPTKSLMLGLLFGIIFGFLLQKGGVAKYHVLIGQLLLADFTVVKVMLSAVVVGMLGIYSLHRANLVEFHIKPTRLASNVIGGLLFGCGFALSAYCPGTGAAAVGQGNFDAIAMMAGMVAGSYVFAEASGWISRHLDPIGDKGKLTLMDLLPLGRTAITFGTAALLVVVLVVLEFTTTR